jgi:UrcA family protein
MKNISLALPGLAIASLLAVGGPGAAQTPDEKAGAQESVTVYAPYVVRRAPLRTPRSVSRLPLSVVTVDRPVSFRDLDLKNPADQQTLETRVNQAAKDACAQLERRYPKNVYVPVPADQDCVKNAVDGTMVVVRELILAANAK